MIDSGLMGTVINPVTGEGSVELNRSGVNYFVCYNNYIIWDNRQGPDYVCR